MIVAIAAAKTADAAIAGLVMLVMVAGMMMEDVKSIIPATKSGRCANGFERDQGRVVHGLLVTETQMRSGAYWLPALCGSRTGKRSAGWCDRKDLAVTCPKCLKKMEKANAEMANLIQHAQRL